MITSISNNIGIAQVSFKDYQSENLTILNGKFTVDSSTATFRAAGEIIFEFASLVMAKSAVSAVYVIDTLPRDPGDKALRGTILKSWIKNNRLYIERVNYFDDYGPLTFVVACAYVTGAQRTPVVKDGFVNTGLENEPSRTWMSEGGLIVKDRYVFCQMSFGNFEGIDGGREQAFDIKGMPDDVDLYVPVVCCNPAVDNRGAALSLGHLQGKHFTCTSPEHASYYGNAGTFFQFFAVRDAE